jgi:hypothetical protein
MGNEFVGHTSSNFSECLERELELPFDVYHDTEFELVLPIRFGITLPRIQHTCPNTCSSVQGCASKSIKRVRRSQLMR